MTAGNATTRPGAVRTRGESTSPYPRTHKT